MQSHFKFSKEQRNGVFLLILFISVLQCVYFFIDFDSEEVSVDQTELVKFQNEIDSLRLIQMEERKPKTYVFNPNYITDFKGVSLGMTNEEIDRLLAFRKQNQWINSAKQFQDVTKISDSLINAISPYFKFPDWVTNSVRNVSTTNFYYNSKPKSFDQKQDLNKATAEHLQKINGIGEVLSDRIIKFRNKFVGGFIADIQLQDVFGLTPEVIERITKEFTVKSPRVVQKINLNNATIEELVTIQHIDYNLARHIFEQRQLRDGFKSIDELTKVKDFPINKIDIIKLYLSLD